MEIRGFSGALLESAQLQLSYIATGTFKYGTGLSKNGVRLTSNDLNTLCSTIKKNNNNNYGRSYMLGQIHYMYIDVCGIV